MYEPRKGRLDAGGQSKMQPRFARKQLVLSGSWPPTLRKPNRPAEVKHSMEVERWLNQRVTATSPETVTNSDENSAAWGDARRTKSISSQSRFFYRDAAPGLRPEVEHAAEVERWLNERVTATSPKRVRPLERPLRLRATIEEANQSLCRTVAFVSWRRPSGGVALLADLAISPKSSAPGGWSGGPIKK